MVECAFEVSMFKLLPLLLILALPQCAASKLKQLSEEPQAPDTTKIQDCFSRWGTGQITPVSPSLALTARHLVDSFPLNKMEPTPCRWEKGVAVPDSFAPSSDLASVRGTFTQWYPIASSPPQVGEQLWAKGLDWRSQKLAYQPRIFTGKVLRVTAGNIILDAEVAPGTSGSGLLNAKGEVVGVVVWGKEMEDGKQVTIAVGVWGFVPEGLTQTE